MKNLIVWLGIISVAAVQVSRGQLVVDNGGTNVQSQSSDISPTNVLIGITAADNILQINNGAIIGAGDVYTGYNSADNSLEVVGGASLLSAAGIIGESAAATGNRVIISGENSGWGMNDSLIVGKAGADNTLSVVDQASVAASSMIVGAFSSSSNNSVLVSEGALNLSGILVVGSAGNSNRLDVTNGGVVNSVNSWMGYTAASSGNVAQVSGTDSAWIDTGVLTVGTNGNSGNRVIVTNGGSITVESLQILGDGNGFDLDAGGTLSVTSDFDASITNFNYNEGSALFVGGDLTGQTNGIDGARTLGVSGTWDQTGSDITVGGSSSNNGLVVLGGGSVTADNVLVGTGSNAVGNTVSISGSGSVLTVTDQVQVGSADSSGNSIDLHSDGQMIVGNGLTFSGSNNTFTVRDGGLLTMNSDFDASIDGFVFGDGGIIEAKANLTGMSNTLDNAQIVKLTGGTWSAGGLVLGDASAGNAVEITAGGTLLTTDAVLGAAAGGDGNEILLSGAGSSWTDSGTVTVGAAGNDNRITLLDGSSVSSAGLVVGSAGNGNTISVGTNAGWNVTGNVNLGVSGSNNRIMIESNGRMDSASASIGGLGTGNEVWVQGANAIWATTGDMTVSGAGNTLRLLEAGSVDVGQQLAVRSGAAVVVESGGRANVTSYYQESDALFRFDSVTNIAIDSGPALVTASGSAEFEDGAMFEFTGTIGDVDVGVTNSRKLVQSSNLIADLSALDANSPNALLQYDFFEQNDDLFLQLYRESLAESAGFESNSQMYAISEEIDTIASGGNPQAIRQLNVLGGMSSAQQNAQLTQLYERNAPTYMHMEGLFEGMRQVKNRGVMPDKMWPVGAYGPHLYGSQVQGWIKGYGSWASQEGSDSFSSYDQSVYGVMIGFDKAYGDFLAGFAGGYASSDISQNDGDSSKSGTGFGMLYGSWGTSDWFGDLSLAYGMGSVENASGTAFDTSSDFDANQLAFYLGGGKELLFRNDTIFLTPSAGVLGGLYSQDGYTERASNAVARRVDEYDRFSFRSELGVKAVFEKELKRTVLMPEVHANWLHEFNTDADQVGFSLVDGTGKYNFGMQSPVADLIELGVGLSLWTESKNGSVYEWGLGFDGRFGDGYTASALNARLVVEF